MPRPPTAFDLRPDWLARRTEPALDPGQPIIDSHHHLYQRPGLRYLLEEYLADLASGHDIRATVAVQARSNTSCALEYLKSHNLSSEVIARVLLEPHRRRSAHQ